MAGNLKPFFSKKREKKILFRLCSNFFTFFFTYRVWRKKQQQPRQTTTGYHMIAYQLSYLFVVCCSVFFFQTAHIHTIENVWIYLLIIMILIKRVKRKQQFLSLSLLILGNFISNNRLFLSPPHTHAQTADNFSFFFCFKQPIKNVQVNVSHNSLFLRL